MRDSFESSRNLAANTLALRTGKGLSQQQLAKLAGIPRSTLTHIESGEGNPSLSNLCKLAEALGVSIEELLTRPRSDVTLLRAADIPVLARSGGKVTVQKLMPDAVRGIEIDRVVLRRRASMGGKPHLNGSKEYLMALEGALTISVAGQDYPVGAGEVLAFPGDQKHAYRNTGSGTAVALSVVLPMPYL